MSQRISRDLAARRERGGCGTRVAQGSPVSRRILAIAAATTLLMGCIIRDFDYEPPANSWPSVESTPSTGTTPLNRIHQIDLSAAIGGDGGVPNDERFEVIVRDDDISQPLQARIYLDNVLIRERPIPAEPDSPDPRRRTFSFFLPRSAITEGCHLVELLVSSQNGFELYPSRNPIEPGDIASAQWWVAASLTEPIEMDRCPVGQ